ncbi:MAG: tRNA (adenosine(37)-N6)-threonylcarbamoyltransferase complex ATPase subunit type 1 TsaE [Candidatus Pelagibacter sp. TMED272]|nr:tRNA (adenosine(37)-N6)-threonylcarbamoyltransferase complex ATPase subunit type 1 TsaE [Pelagibacteraceae bacterium]RPG93484.1 MAG: tRNA (adenosine(37)-N6)-threonylcarbamoyltransferase complex ATPase subunit type 1 TsaE [Candidatus Pelagibacter sp. TMED272]|tara:strand:+ start:25726 stop:26181 length:456 start_codon:yes stop_codon:yes gene_type:complete
MIIKSLEHLKSISNKIAENTSSNDCIFLIGEIGVGKTTFTRNFINYLQKKEGIKETEVLSPTFNLLYEYDIRNLKVMHYDLYRIKKKKELEQLGIFREDNNSIKIIEWPELIEINVSDRLELYLKYSVKENERELSFVGHGKWKDITKNEF